MTIEEYFVTDYTKEKGDIEQVIKIINEVLPTFSHSIYNTNRGNQGWVYIIKSGEDPKYQVYSASTSSMILKVLKEVLNQKSYNDGGLETIFNLQVKNLKKKFKKNNCFYSNSFGKDDIFTLGWCLDILHNPSKKDSSILEIIKKLIISKTKEFLDKPNAIDKIFDFKSNEGKKDEALEHTFPYLKMIQAYISITEKYDIKDEYKTINTTETIKPYFLSKIHEHLSYSEIPNSNFDTAELVFALEGVLLIDKEHGYKSVNYKLIDRIFKVIETSQFRSPYWRPLKPFMATPQGMVLLPLSIEVANSLLRICKLLEGYKEFYFSNYINLFKTYTDWLYSRLTIIKKNGGNDIQTLSGWHSEHVNKAEIIHPWETAQVIHYLINYSKMLQEHIGRTTLKLSFLQENKIPRDNKISTMNYWDEYVQKTFDPFPTKSPNSEKLNVFTLIGNAFVKPVLNRAGDPHYSMLLYGPPGTGKTTVAGQLAASLEWPLITITPSDFLAKGPSNVEANAKIIFKTLMEQENKVVFFDEIDRLIIDRESESYNNQDDVFQFMTPSMLVKLADLRNKKKLIFIIATNYEDTIDKAIKRIGRIDFKYCILPPNKEARLNIAKRILVKFLNDKKEEDTYKKVKFPDPNALSELNLNSFLKETCFYTYGEIQSMIMNRFGSGYNLKNLVQIEEIERLLNMDAIDPSIELKSYQKRLNDNGANQKPILEYLLLSYLKLEVAEDEYEKSDIFKNLIKNVRPRSIDIDKILPENEFEMVRKIITKEKLKLI